MLPASLFANVVLHALRTEHRHFALTSGEAVRYPADVAPFAAVAAPTTAAFRDLGTLLTPGESVWVIAEQPPETPELVVQQTIPVLQMVLPADIPVPEPAAAAPVILPLPESDAPDMVALTDIAFPGFFRAHTNRMGPYYGIRSQGELIAMSGTRLTVSAAGLVYPEISGVCTHPGHRGHGHAAALMWQLVRDHRQAGHVSWLHVTATNTRAVSLYEHMGFLTARTIQLHRVAIPG